MNSIRKEYGLSPSSGDLGLELECEFPERVREVPKAVNDAWVIKNDGSLRNFGIEFVSRRPFKFDDSLRPKVEALCDYVLKMKAYHDSPRTSFHVHRNVKDFTPLQVYNIITGYWLLEPCLMEFCGPDRRGSLFCLQLQHAESMIVDLKSSVSSSFFEFHVDSHKYSAMNLSAITRYGSLEFRGMRGVTDPDTILDWSSALFKITAALANDFSDPADVIDAYSCSESKEFIKRLIPEGSLRDFVLSLDSVDDMLMINAPVLAEFAYSFDWDQYKSTSTRSIHKENRPVRERRAVRGNLLDVLNGALAVPAVADEVD